MMVEDHRKTCYNGTHGIKRYDLSGKTIIPFAMSGGSELGDTVKRLASSCPEARFLNGRVFSPSASQTELLKWADQRA